MTRNRTNTAVSKLRAVLWGSQESRRLQAALTAGMHPDPEYIEVLVERSGVEPDFYVRDTLTWALTRHDASLTVDRLLIELTSATPQARSQSLHTLSKIGDRRAWPAITPQLLRDKDDEVARAAWRTATGLVPDDSRAELAEELATQFDRGDRQVQLSLSRAFVALGETAEAVVTRAKTDERPGVRAHAIATERLMHNPDEEFDTAIDEANRIAALLSMPQIKE